MVRLRCLQRLGAVHLPDATAASQITLAGERNGHVERSDEPTNRRLRTFGWLCGHADLCSVDHGKPDSRSVCMDLNGSPEAIVVGYGQCVVAEIRSALNELTCP